MELPDIQANFDVTSWIFDDAIKLVSFEWEMVVQKVEKGNAISKIFSKFVNFNLVVIVLRTDWLGPVDKSKLSWRIDVGNQRRIDGFLLEYELVNKLVDKYGPAVNTHIPKCVFFTEYLWLSMIFLKVFLILRLA